MSKQLRIWLFVLLGTLLTSTSLLADGVITMTTSKTVGEHIFLRIEANGNVTIEGAKELGSLTSDYGNEYVKEYEIKNRTITIRGDVTELYCGVPGWVGRPGYWDSQNSLTSLDVSGCTTLTKLNCFGNKLTSLDVSKNTALTELECSYNQLTSFDVSKNTYLKDLDCYNNQLTSLHLSKNSALKFLECGGNQLTSLDVSKNTALETLCCSENQLTSLRLSKNSALQYLNCSANQLTSLDLSACPWILHVYCTSNMIKGEEMIRLMSSLPSRERDMDGNIHVVTSHAPEENVCPRAAVSIARAKSWNVLKYDKDGESSPYNGANEKLQVGHGVITLTTTKAIGETISLTIWANGRVALDGVKDDPQPDGTRAYYTLTSQTITIRGDVTLLYCEGNQLTSLDVSKNTDLIWLNCKNNRLTSLDVSRNTFLTKINCSNNQLTSLDVSGCPKLENLACLSNQIKESEMTKLVNSLPLASSGLFDVLIENSSEGNVCLANHVAIAKKKHWHVRFMRGSGSGDNTGVETTVTQQVKLYPNPATDHLVVEGIVPASEVTLYSMTGERLYAGRADSRGTLQIDLTPYADGVYLVCVAGETYRVVVRR